jgi:glycosyltransferase 2 family protein
MSEPNEKTANALGLDDTARKSGALSLVIKSAVAIAISVLALWFAFRGVDLGYVMKNLARTSAGVIALYIAIQVAIHASRVVRYWLLVRPLAPVSPRAVFSAVSVGLPASVFLPLRLGEVVRPLMMSRAGLPLPSAFASVVVERVTDGLLNVGLFFLFLQMLPESANVPPELRTLALLPLFGFGGGLVFLGIAYVARGPVLALLERILARVSEGFAKKVVTLLSTFLDGLVALKTPGRLLAYVALTIFYWTVNGWATWLLAVSYGLDVPWMAGPFTISCVVFAVTVPAAPGFAGTLEAGFRVGMVPFGASPDDVVLVALVAHTLQLVMLALFAFAGFQFAEPGQRKRSA